MPYKSKEQYKEYNRRRMQKARQGCTEVVVQPDVIVQPDVQPKEQGFVTSWMYMEASTKKVLIAQARMQNYYDSQRRTHG